MSCSRKRSSALVLTLALAFAPFGYATENIVETVEVSPSLSGKVERLLMVGTSALNTDVVLGNKQALIGAEVRKLLKGAGVSVLPIGVKVGETDLKEFVAQAVAKSTPSHIMTITIPSGVVLVRRSTGESIGAHQYVVRAEIVEAKQNAVVWNYSAEVSAGFVLGASNAQVAESIVARLRADGLL